MVANYYCSNAAQLLTALVDRGGPRNIIPTFTGDVTLTDHLGITNGDFTYHGEYGNVRFRNYSVTLDGCENVRLHYFRSRAGHIARSTSHRSLRLNNCQNVKLTNSSLTMASDENLIIDSSDRVTIYRTIIANALHLFSTTPDRPQSRNLNIRNSDRVSVSECVIANGSIRNPKYVNSSGEQRYEFANNAIYNCSQFAWHLDYSGAHALIDAYNNLIITGPLTNSEGTDGDRFAHQGGSPDVNHSIYLADNIGPTRAEEDPEIDIVEPTDQSRFTEVSRQFTSNGVTPIAQVGLLAALVANVGLVGKHDGVETQLLTDVQTGDAPTEYYTAANYPSLT